MGRKEEGLDWYGEERRGVRLVWGGKKRGLIGIRGKKGG